MSLHGFYTDKGAVLAAKIDAGTKLTVTKVTAGSGTTPPSASVLAATQQTLATGAPRLRGQTAILPVTLTEVSAPQSYVLTELGVYAQDPDEGEILYQVFRLSAVQAITAGGSDTLRFYLRQTVSTSGAEVVYSSAGVVLEGDAEPVVELVLPVAAQEKTVSVDAADLQDYLDALPRLLAVSLKIYVTDTVTEEITIRDFYGGGSLAFYGVTFQKPLQYNAVRVPVQMVSCSFEPSGVDQYATAVIISGCRSVELLACTIDGSSANQIYGALVDSSCVHFSDTDIKNCWIAVQSSACGLTAIKGGSFSGNTFGAGVQFGAITTMGAGVPQTLGGTSNLQQGGLLVGPNGTVI